MWALHDRLRESDSQPPAGEEARVEHQALADPGDVEGRRGHVEWLGDIERVDPRTAAEEDGGGPSRAVARCVD